MTDAPAIDLVAIARAIDLAGGAAAVAAEIGCSPQAVYLYRNGRRQFPEVHAATLEGMCKRAVRRWHMYPHSWRRIWPELADAPDAPIPQAA